MATLIFGQTDYAERLNYYLKELFPSEQIHIFAFSLNEENPASYSFDFSLYDKDLSGIDKQTPIIAAFGGKYRDTAVNHLEYLGFNNIQHYDSKMDNDLKRKFFKSVFSKKRQEFSLIDEEKSVVVYMAKSVADKPLKNFPQNLSARIIPIQVGATLTDKKIADVTDDTGDNISDRNRHYSETTALYWIWKNATADYLGLCHYRRLWKDLDGIVNHLQNGIFDVVLPLPTLMIPSVMEGHLRYYTQEVCETMLNVLKRRSLEYYEVAQKIYDGNIFYASNMFIAKRHVLNHLCEWMFPIVMETEEIVGDLSDSYRNRYCGFCTEQLITLYFLYNKQNWRITHAEKIFIE